MVVAAYVNVLSDQPPWAVNEAAKRWARGEAGGNNPAFPPSAAEMHQVAAAVISTVQAELFNLHRTLVGVVADRSLTFRSREQQKAIDSQIMSTASTIALKDKAAALGLDPDAALASIPNAPPRDNGSLKQLVAGTIKPMSEAAE